MKIMRKAAVICALGCLLTAGAAQANDAVLEVPLDTEIVNVDINPQLIQSPVMYITYGKITAIEDGFVIVKGEGHRPQIAARVDSDTYVVDGLTGKLRLPRRLQVGQTVSVFYDSQLTRSLPPQGKALAFVIGEKTERTAAYLKVDQAVLSSDGKYMTVVSNNNDLVVTIGAEACADYQKIKKGDSLLLWSSVVTLSLPGQTTAEKAILLP